MAFVEEVHLKTALDLVEALKPWGTEFETKDYIFRGHPDSNYQLVPSALRNHGDALWRDETTNPTELNRRRHSELFQVIGEYSILAEFYKLADRRGLRVPVADSIRKQLSRDVQVTVVHELHMPIWPPDDLLEVAALAQHYGVPTSLLDWSHDPLTAAYFASESCDSLAESEPEFFCVWALNRSKLSMYQSGMQWPLRFVTPHVAGNKNIFAQAGVFTLWQRKLPPDRFDALMLAEVRCPIERIIYTDRRGLDEQLGLAFKEQMRKQGEDEPLDSMFNVLKKFIVPSTEKQNLRRILRSADLGPSRIFPGYDGCAREVLEEKVPQIRLNGKDESVADASNE